MKTTIKQRTVESFYWHFLFQLSVCRVISIKFESSLLLLEERIHYFNLPDSNWLFNHSCMTSWFLLTQFMLVRTRSRACWRPLAPAPASGYFAKKSSICVLKKKQFVTFSDEINFCCFCSRERVTGKSKQFLYQRQYNCNNSYYSYIPKRSLSLQQRM